ncbi:hypothetical protein Tco_0216622 [Tanacetum coccineum]
MTTTHKGVVYLNQHNVKSLMRLSEVKKICDGTLVKIRENMIDMVTKNKLGKENKRLKGRDWTNDDVVKSNEMVNKIDKTLKCREQLKRLEEYVRGRPKTVNPRTLVRPIEKAEGHGDWNSSEYQDTANSGGKKETKAFIFHKMETEEASDRYVAPCFINALEAYDDDLDFGDIPEIEGVEIPPFVCKMGKNSRNKRKQLEKYQLIYSDMGPSLSTKKPLTQEEAAREALAIDIYGEIKKEEEEAIIKIKGEALIDKEDPGAFVIPIRLEAKTNLIALSDTGSDVNVMPYRVYKELGREEVKPVNRGITMLNHSKAEPMGLLKEVLCQIGVVGN